MFSKASASDSLLEVPENDSERDERLEALSGLSMLFFGCFFGLDSYLFVGEASEISSGSSMSMA